MFPLKKTVSSNELAEALDLPFFGEADIQISNVASYDRKQAGSLCFLTRGQPKASSSVVFASEKNVEVAVILSSQPRLDFIRSLEYLDKTPGFLRSDRAADIHPSAKIGANVFVDTDVVIGANTIIEPNVVILAGTRIGSQCLIRANATLGSDGFGFERLADGTPVKFIHLGGLHIGDNVEIGANTCIAKGTLGNTVIEDRVKIDNLVHIAHNCLIRQGAFVIAGAEISGGVDIGENAWIAPQACTMQKIKIGNNATVGLGAVVTKDVEEQAIVVGNPASPLSRKSVSPKGTDK